MTLMHSLFTIRARRRAPALAAWLLAVVAACSDGNAPKSATFDAARVDAGLQAAQRAIEAPAVSSFLALSPSVAAAPGVNASAAVAGVRAVLSARTVSPDSARGAALVLARALDAAPEVSEAPLLPSTVLGTTFVFSPITQGYVPAPGRAGAPANGVRFVLYAVNPVTKQPVLETEIGYAELTDEGGAAFNRVAYRLRVVSGGVTYLDYGVQADVGLTGVQVGVDGFASDGTTRLDFDVDVGAHVQNGEAQLEVAFAFDVPTQNFHTRATVRGSDALGGSAEVTMKVIAGGDTVDVAASFAASGLDATFRVNGFLFATATGNPAQPVIRGADGHELSQAEMAVLGGIVRLIESQFLLLGALLAPLG